MKPVDAHRRNPPDPLILREHARGYHPEPRVVNVLRRGGEFDLPEQLRKLLE